MTLKGFMEGGYDVSDGKILVVVKSISAKVEVVEGMLRVLVMVGGCSVCWKRWRS